MIHTTTNAIVNVPLNTPITDEDEFVLRRGTLTVTLEVIDHTEFQAQVQIPADQTTGEWTYTLGSNRGIIAITNPNGGRIQYGESSGSMEYDGRARNNGNRIDALGVTTKNTWESGNIPVDNTIYNLGELASLTIAGVPATNTYGIVIYFESGASATTFTYPASSKWTISEAPTIEANKAYRITILDKVFGIDEITTLP